jgi:hypothetical protein
LNKKYSVQLAFLLLLIALCARLVPLQFSDLPYNIDGFPLARISDIMIDTGKIPDAAGFEGLLGYNMKLPVFSMVLAMFSLVLGIEPLALLPYFCALIGSLSVIFVYALARELTENELAAFSAGMFAALTGLFVYVTTAAMKQLLAITLLCFILYLYSRRRDWRFRLAMVAGLFILPFTHHLTSLIALLALSFSLAGTAFRRSEHHVRTPGEFVLDALTGPCILLVSLLYYRFANLEIVDEVMNLNDAVLLASVALISAVAARMLSMTAQTKPWFFMRGSEGKGLTVWNILDEKVLVLVVGIGALYLNSRMHVFLGGRMTSDTLLRLIFPYLLLAVLALIGFNVLRYSKFPRRHIMVGMFLAPICVMVFSMLRGLDVFGFMVAYRSYNFMDIPLAIAAGVGLAYIVGILKKLSNKQAFYKPLPVFAVGIFILLCAMSLPLAYNSQEAFGVQEVTMPHEMSAMGWAAEHGITEIAADQRYGDIIEPYWDVKADKTGPWRIQANAMTSGSTIIMSASWTHAGAQMYPLENVVFSEASVNNFLDASNVCYVGGPAGEEIYIAVTD